MTNTWKEALEKEDRSGQVLLAFVQNTTGKNSFVNIAGLLRGEIRREEQ